MVELWSVSVVVPGEACPLPAGRSDVPPMVRSLAVSHEARAMTSDHPDVN